MNKQLLEKANHLIKECATVHLGVVDEQGYPVVMSMSILKPDNVSEIYLSTTTDSNKAQCIQKNNKACICFSTDAYNATLVGEIELLTDQETKSKYWQDWLLEHYQGGETDPTYCILKFTARRAALYIDGEMAEITL